MKYPESICLHAHDTDPETVADNSATYCPEDDKIRLYIGGDGRVQRQSYEYLTNIGYKSTPKQSCQFVATWSEAAEDAALDLIADDDDIGDEDYSPEERAADRAERFSGYRDKRLSEAHGHADTYQSGPSAFGFQSQARAERAARRHERHRDKALCQWGKAEYWHRRTDGVIRHALHRQRPDVRRERVLGLESSIRAIKAKYTPNEPRHAVQQTDRETGEQVEYVWCGKGRGGYWRKVSELEAIERGYARLLAHLEMRLIYENAMLENEGGKASDVNIVPGGWIRVRADRFSQLEHVDGWAQIVKVSKSSATGKVVSVQCWGRDYYNHNPNVSEHPKRKLMKINIQRCGEDIYREPTPEDLATFLKAMQEANKAEKAERKKNPAPSLINPTREDAERLQAAFNSCYPGRPESPVVEITMAIWKRWSAGDAGKTVQVTEQLKPWRTNLMNQQPNGRHVVFKVRTLFGGFSQADRIVVITDKPQKALPFDRAEEIRQAVPNRETIAPLLQWMHDETRRVSSSSNWSPELRELVENAVAVDFFWMLSQSQYGLTSCGEAAIEQTEQVTPDAVTV